jgi:uncharacterized cupredoxin-like copper-binding protein
MTPNERKILIAALLASVIMSVATVVGFIALIQLIWSLL